MPDKFALDQRLSDDSHFIGHWHNSVLLLMRNACYPWFVLVPDTQQTEFYELDKTTQLVLLDQINQLSDFIKKNFPVEKLNIATIGNIVSQLHIHLIGRHSNDPVWPGVVWGQGVFEEYNSEQLDELFMKLHSAIPELTD